MSNHESIRKLWVVMPVFIVFAFLLIVQSTGISISNNSNFGPLSILCMVNRIKRTPIVQISLNIHNIPVKKVHVGDIDVAYKMFGKGEPIILFNGASDSMDAWDPSFLTGISSNHIVIAFNQRGIANTTAGSKPYTYQQLANKTAGLLDALKIPKADVMGYSLGGHITQAVYSYAYPGKVNRLILVATTCGGKDAYT